MAISKVILDDTTLIDVTDKTVDTSNMLYGATALKNDGTSVTGSIVSKTSSDVSISGNTVTVPAGYYASQATASVDSGTIINGASKPSGTSSSGTISRDTYIKIGAGYYDTDLYYAAQSNSGTKSITSSGTTTVNGYYYASVSSGSITNNTSGGTSSGTINRGSQIKIGAGYYDSDTYYTAQSNSGTKSITSSGTTSVDGYANVSVSAGTITNNTSGGTSSGTINRGSQIKIGAGYYDTDLYYAAQSNSGTKSITSSGTTTVNGYYYASVSAGTITNNTSGGTSSGTIDRGSQIKIGAGYYDSDTYYTAQSNSGTYTVSSSGTKTVNGYYYASVSSCSVTNNTTLPSGSSSSGTINAGSYIKIGTGYNDSIKYYKAADASSPSLQNKSVSPTESSQSITCDSGYDGLGTVTVGAISTTYVGSGVTTKSATTYNVSSSAQTISSGTYLTGTQTIRAVTTENISAENIKSGVTIKVGDSGSAGRIKNVTGTYAPAYSVSGIDTTAPSGATAGGYTNNSDGYYVSNASSRSASVRIIVKVTGSVDGNSFSGYSWLAAAPIAVWQKGWDGGVASEASTLTISAGNVGTNAPIGTTNIINTIIAATSTGSVRYYIEMKKISDTETKLYFGSGPQPSSNGQLIGVVRPS